MLQLTAAIIIAITMADRAFAQHYHGEMVEVGQAMSPRYFLGSPLPAKRDLNCPTGSHLCQDINQPGACCPDDHYCYTNTQGQAQCCALGSICDNPCSSLSYYCGPTSNGTGTASATASATTSASAICCQKSCTAETLFQCASTLGGGCCSLGFSCVPSNCVSTAVAPTSVVSVIPSGCTTNQFSCASSIGGGCCDNGLTCTNSGTGLYCASGTNAPSAIRTGPNGTLVSGISQSSPQDTGLSTGAKVGIGVGIAIIGCLIGAGLLWFCMRRRKAAQVVQSGSQQSESLTPGREQSMSQAGGARSNGMTDYFGPAARQGPYTENESPGSTPARGVPLSPHSPGDIVGAVEIGHSRDNSNVTSPGDIVERPPTPEYLKEVPESTEHRVELP